MQKSDGALRGPCRKRRAPPPGPGRRPCGGGTPGKGAGPAVLDAPPPRPLPRDSSINQRNVDVRQIYHVPAWCAQKRRVSDWFHTNSARAAGTPVGPRESRRGTLPVETLLEAGGVLGMDELGDGFPLLGQHTEHLHTRDTGQRR